MAIQTLQTIKNWFKTTLKPTQAQFWDTWDSFRHKYDKVPVKDVDGIDELLAEAINQIPTLNGNPDRLTKIDFNSKGNFNLTESNITDTGDKITINSNTEIDSGILNDSGLILKQLEKNIVNEYFFQDNEQLGSVVLDTDGTIYFTVFNNDDDTSSIYKFSPSGKASLFAALERYSIGITLNQIDNCIYVICDGDILKISKNKGEILNKWTQLYASDVIISDNYGNVYFKRYKTLNKIDQTGYITSIYTFDDPIQTLDISTDGIIYVTTEKSPNKPLYKIVSDVVTLVYTFNTNGNIWEYGSDSNNNTWHYINNLDEIWKISESGERTVFSDLPETYYKGTIDPDTDNLVLRSYNSGIQILSPIDCSVISSFKVKGGFTDKILIDSIGNIRLISPAYFDGNTYKNSIILETYYKEPQEYALSIKEGKIFKEKKLLPDNNFKTINGESILGDGDISISAGAAGGLDATLAAKNHADSPIILSDYYVSPEYYQGLKLFASTGNTILQNHYSGGITGFLELKPGNLGLWQAATDSTGNSASMEISGGGWGRAPEITFNKRINGEYSLCSVKAADPSEIDDLTTKRYVDSIVIAKAGIDSPVFTGVPSVPTAAISTNTTQVASTAFVNAAIENSIKDRRPYKIYTALLSQIEENDPTAIVLENTLGGEVVWTRMYGGTYKGTLQGAFTVDRTTVFVETKFSELAYITGTEVDYEGNCVYLKTCQGALDLSDEVLRKTAIEIKVYN